MNDFFWEEVYLARTLNHVVRVSSMGVYGVYVAKFIEVSKNHFRYPPGYMNRPWKFPCKNWEFL